MKKPKFNLHAIIIVIHLLPLIISEQIIILHKPFINEIKQV